MKIVIVGYGELFRAVIAGVLNTKHTIAGVFLHENVICSVSERFFNNILNPYTDANFVKNKNLKRIFAPSVNSEKFRKELKKLNPDLIITASWSEKFSQETINIPKYGCLNVHPSLLPKYRGPNPYLQVILNGETRTGISFHKMDSNFDTGSVLYQTEVEILESDTGGSLKLRCSDKVREHLPFVLENFDDRLKNEIIQDENQATYQKRITLSEAILDFNKESSIEISRRIRALDPWLNCYICHKSEFFSFKKFKIIDEISNKAAGSIVHKKGNTLCIVCNDNKVIEFSDLMWMRFNLKLATMLYLKFVV